MPNFSKNEVILVRFTLWDAIQTVLRSMDYPPFD